MTVNVYQGDAKVWFGGRDPTPLADLAARGTIPGMSNDVDVEAVVTAVKQAAKNDDTNEAAIRELAVGKMFG